MKPRIFYDGVSYRVKGWKKIRQHIVKVITEEYKNPGDLNFVLTTDRRLLKINKEFLKHNYFTDVITFTLADNDSISGEIYISIDTVKKNARNYKVSCYNELLRVMIHGSLHLCGYEDGTVDERILMREREDYWINDFLS
ncbi:MAG: rRNA maturation RNase YbeY [Bacteroidales bacterium]